VAAAAVAVMAMVEEEEEQGAVDCDGDRAADGDMGPVAHGDREDGDGSTAVCAGRMTTTTGTADVGGGSGTYRAS
jgi:hypothetical protein